jgi:hypothetical protein
MTTTYPTKLKWLTGLGLDGASAHTSDNILDGQYSIERRGKHYRAWWFTLLGTRPDRELGKHPTIAEAQAACETDYVVLLASLEAEAKRKAAMEEAWLEAKPQQFSFIFANKPTG